jgi:hypothetical protein
MDFFVDRFFLGFTTNYCKLELTTAAVLKTEPAVGPTGSGHPGVPTRGRVDHPRFCLLQPTVTP